MRSPGETLSKFNKANASWVPVRMPHEPSWKKKSSTKASKELSLSCICPARKMHLKTWSAHKMGWIEGSWILQALFLASERPQQLHLPAWRSGGLHAGIRRGIRYRRLAPWSSSLRRVTSQGSFKSENGSFCLSYEAAFWGIGRKWLRKFAR